jgi:indole-3-glycerol phosphate synthase
MSTVLDSIIDGVREDLANRQAKVSQIQLEALIRDVAPALPAAANLRDAAFSVISEVKRSSPSKGHLAEISSPQTLASKYAEGEAAVVSVLTEERRFSGTLADLDIVRANIDIPILRKDFMVTEYQILESRAHGADVVLLIVAGLDQTQLRDFNDVALGLGMSVLVEIHDEAELDRAMDIEPALLGVNARNLKTLEVDLAVCQRLIPMIPKEIVAIAESGIATIDDVIMLSRGGADAILVGEALVRGGDPVETVREWKQAGTEERNADGVR